MSRTYFYSHDKIDFLFNKNSDNFIVKENPLYDFSGSGEHLVLTIRKKNLTTWELIDRVAHIAGVKSKEIGYAGLKDKHALSVQNISIHKKYESVIQKIENSSIKILATNYHDNKIKIGHLKSNNFRIMLKKVDRVNANKLTQVLKSIKSFGIPNYFGFQRFGNDGKNYELGAKIVEKDKKPRGKKELFLVSAYQSKLFNEWLQKRVELSIQLDSFSNSELKEFLNIEDSHIYKEQPHKFKLLEGDLMHHYPHGKIFLADDLQTEAIRFFDRQIVPTGGLFGKKIKHSANKAYEIERNFDKISTLVNGSRRFAWIFAEDIEYEYKESDMHFLFSFTLPKGSYATTLLEELSHKEMKNEL
jgi:tRNA pseudouridine13 synthase